MAVFSSIIGNSYKPTGLAFNNMESFKKQLEQAELSKQMFAHNLGLNIKTVYSWKDNPPKYALAFLEQYTLNREHKQGRAWMRRYLGID